MSGWTDADSEALDAEIRSRYPDRRPLRYDPVIGETIAGPLAPEASHCVGCGRIIWHGHRNVPDGYLRHKGHGRCGRCYHHRHSNTRRLATVPVETVTELTRVGLSANEIAARLGVHQRTIQRRRKKVAA